MLRFLLIAGALALSISAFVACTDENADQGAPTSTAAATQPASTQPSGTPAPSPTPLISIQTTEAPAEAQFGHQAIIRPGTATGSATVTLAQAGSPGDFDRLTFQFDGGLPGYQISYLEELPSECGSGLTVQMQGVAFLQVRLAPAAAHDDTGSPTLASTDLTPGLTQLLEARQVCDFEGVVTWVLGLNADTDFRVFAIGDSILVVDVKY